MFFGREILIDKIKLLKFWINGICINCIFNSKIVSVIFLFKNYYNIYYVVCKGGCYFF